MKLRPLGNKVVVKVNQGKRKTEGGLFLPDTSIEEKAEGKIVHLGMKMDPDNELKVGEQVLFGKYAGDEIFINDEKYKILAETELLCVILDH